MMVAVPAIKHTPSVLRLQQQQQLRLLLLATAIAAAAATRLHHSCNRSCGGALSIPLSPIRSCRLVWRDP